MLDVWAGDSPLPRFCPFPLGLASAQNTSERARGEGRGRATKSRVLGRSGAQRRRGVGGKTRFGSGSRGTSGQSSFKPLKPPVVVGRERKIYQQIVLGIVCLCGDNCTSSWNQVATSGSEK